MQPTDPSPRSAVRLETIDAEEAGQRLDNYLLRRLKGVPRSRVYRLLRRGEVRVNGRRPEASYRLEAGDRVRIPPVRESAPAGREPQPGASLPVLHEDERLLVVDKPAGVAVHGGSGVRSGLIETLRARRPSERFLELVHRLDRETSGCLMLARRRSALRTLHELLREGAIEKRYLALVEGDWANAGLVEAALDTSHHRGGERIVRVHGEGKAAASRFQAVQRYGRATLVEVEIYSGRTHQIRVHAAHAGHPLAGDSRYGSERFNTEARALGLRRLFLHAHSVGFAWPDTGEVLHVSSPLPEALRTVLDALSRDDQAPRRDKSRRRR
jgi:23S rRNA pseudouridine955/2504/2580 synthase